MSNIPQEYLSGYDFGFSAVDEMPRTESLDDEFDNVRVTTELEVKDKLVQVEKMIMPLLVNLLKNADKDYIHWPNRAPKIQEQIDKLLAVTRET